MAVLKKTGVHRFSFMKRFLTDFQMFLGIHQTIIPWGLESKTSLTKINCRGARYWSLVVTVHFRGITSNSRGCNSF